MVLDNFEHVAGAAPLVGELLAAAPALTVLATSRSSLRVEGEHVYEVPPLDVDDGVALFVARARAVTVGFALTDEMTAAVEEICRRVDGLPLAIELAAARVRILPPSALLARLDRRLELLTDGRRGGPERQQTLRATIDWSYHLLDPAHRTLLARVAVFRGGFTPEAAEKVAGVPPTEVLDGLAALVEGSLLRQDERAGEPRFTQLETIREYGLERLAQRAQDADVRRRHANFFLELAERAEPYIRGPLQEVWLARLELDRENLRAGLAWADDTKEPELALRFVGALAWFWILRGDLREAQEWLDRVLERPDSREPSLARAKALAAKALLAAFYWDIERAEAPAREALELARVLHAPWPQAIALNVLGTVARVRGDHTLAQARYDEVVALDPMLEDRWPTTLALVNLGIQAFQRGDDERAAEVLERGLVLSRESGDRFWTAFAFDLLGRVAQRTGDLRRAAALHQESLAVCQTLGNGWATAMCLEGVAELEADSGQHARAACLFGAEEAVRAATKVEMWAGIRASHNRTIEDLRATLGEEAFASAFAEGRALGHDEALALALDTAAPATDTA